MVQDDITTKMMVAEQDMDEQILNLSEEEEHNEECCSCTNPNLRLKNRKPRILSLQDEQTKLPAIMTTPTPNTITTSIEETTSDREMRESTLISNDDEMFTQRMILEDTTTLLTTLPSDTTTTVLSTISDMDTTMMTSTIPDEDTTTMTSTLSSEDTTTITSTMSDEDTTTMTSTMSGDDTTTITSTISNDDTTTENFDDEASTQLPRGGKQFGDFDTNFPDNPIGNALEKYFVRVQKIFEADLKVIQNAMELLAAVNTTLIPTLKSTLEPLLSIEEIQNLDIKDIVENAGKALTSSKLEVKLSNTLGNLDFLDVDPMVLDPDNQIKNIILEEDLVKKVSHLITAEFDETGLGFPIRALFLGKEVYHTLNGYKQKRLVSLILAQKLTEFIEKTKSKIQVQDGEVIIDTYLPELRLANRCDLGAKLGRTKAKAVLKRTSEIGAGGSIKNLLNFKPEVTVIAEGELDLDLSIIGSVHARAGKDFFGLSPKCFTKFQQNLPLSMKSSGRVWVGVNIEAKNIRIEHRTKLPHVEYHEFYSNNNEEEYYHGPPAAHYSGESRQNSQYQTRFKREDKTESNKTMAHLVFNLDINLKARVIYWNVKNIWISNCQIKFLRITVFSYCGILRNTLKKTVERFANENFNVRAPKLLNNIERLLLYNIGDEIAIPLILVDEKAKLLESLLVKAISVTSLKAELAKDISFLAQQLLPAFNPTQDQS